MLEVVWAPNKELYFYIGAELKFKLSGGYDPQTDIFIFNGYPITDFRTLEVNCKLLNANSKIRLSRENILYLDYNYIYVLDKESKRKLNIQRTRGHKYSDRESKKYLKCWSEAHEYDLELVKSALISQPEWIRCTQRQAVEKLLHQLSNEHPLKKSFERIWKTTNEYELSKGFYICITQQLRTSQKTKQEQVTLF